MATPKAGRLGLALRSSRGLIGASAQRIVLGRLLVLLTLRRLARRPDQPPEASSIYANRARTAYQKYNDATSTWQAALTRSAENGNSTRCAALARELNSTLNDAVQRADPGTKYEIATDMQLLDELLARLSATA